MTLYHVILNIIYEGTRGYFYRSNRFLMKYTSNIYAYVLDLNFESHVKALINTGMNQPSS